MRDIRSVRPIDAAIAAVAALTIVVAGFLGYSIWQQNRTVKAAVPMSRAIEEIKQAIRKNPGDISLRMQLAQAYSVAGQDKEATEQYLEVLKAKEDYLPALSGLGFLASRNRDWDKAEEYWLKIITALEGRPTALMSKQYEVANFYLGSTYLEQKKYEQAVARFKEALRVDKAASDTHYLLAHAFKGMGADEEYREELEITLAFDPNMPEANYDYGLVLLEEGNEAAAAHHFRISSDQAPDRAEPADELQKLGPFSKRLAAAKKLAGSDPEAASKEARIAVALEPRDYEALLLLGKLYEKIGEKDLALDTYRQAVAATDESEEAEKAVDRMTNDK